MQCRYVGDLGDFGKYGLLKALCKDNLRLGVVWYLTKNEGHNNDGKYIEYLIPSEKNSNRFRVCDPDLYDGLRKIVVPEDDTKGNVVSKGKRCVISIREEKILPRDTVFYEEPLIAEKSDVVTIQCDHNTHEVTKSSRKQWLDDAQEKTKGQDVVFIDPDNGFQVDSVQRHHTRAPKYTFFDDLSTYLKMGKSLVVYQHIARNKPAKDQIRERFKQIKENFFNGPGIHLPNDAFALQYHRGAARVFFVIPGDDKHKQILRDRARCFLDGHWSEHFDRPVELKGEELVNIN